MPYNEVCVIIILGALFRLEYCMPYNAHYLGSIIQEE